MKALISTCFDVVLSKETSSSNHRVECCGVVPFKNLEIFSFLGILLIKP